VGERHQCSLKRTLDHIAPEFSRYGPASPALPLATIAPYPIELAERLVRMFSFVADTVLDPSCAPALPTSPPPIEDATA
jgi:hypothetical protein